MSNIKMNSLFTVFILIFYYNKIVNSDTPIVSFFLNDTRVYSSNFLNIQDIPTTNYYDSLKISSGYLNDSFWQSVSFLPQIQILTIKNCSNILTIPEEYLGHYPNLKNLTVTKTKLEELKKKTFQDIILTKLNLQENNISKIDDGIFKNQSKLVEINLKLNDLMVLKTGLFSDIPNLKIITLYGNGMIRIEVKAFRNLQVLEILNLNENELREWKDQFLDNVPNLKTLQLAHNKIESFQNDSFKSLKALETLDLTDNKIRQIDRSTFSGLNNLRKLSLSLNEIQFIAPGFLETMPNLEQLVLTYNKLRVIEKGTFIHSKLESIKLDHNKISEIDSGSFVNLTALKVLSFIDNNITDFKDGVLVNAPKLTTVSLEANPILWRWEQFYYLVFAFPELVTKLQKL